jgi:RNA polymerase sigma factor (sigma-70 family)
MAAAQLATVLNHLRQLAEVRRADALGDAELLARFVARHDEAAFAALLQRHGPMVMGVCRRILRDAHDAEDAFQATFLVLVRKAGSIGKGASLGYWLYEVAYRTALRAKLGAARRRQRERRAQEMTDTDPLTDSGWEELRPLLDEELHRLPEKYREPFVLCYLQGKTHGEAAEQLGWPKGTVSGRLARARDVLRARLARHGVTLTAGLLVTALVRGASAAVPRRLLGATLKAALRFASGRAADGFPSVEAVTLAKGVLQGMSTNKLKLALAVLLTVGLLGGGAVGSSRQAGDPKAPPAAKAAVEAAPLPEGATARMGTADFRHGDRIFFIAYTADGKQLITASRDQTVRLWDAATGKEIRRFDRSPRPGEKEDPAEGAFRMPMGIGPDPSSTFLVALAPDGKTLAATRGATLILWDVASGKELRRLSGPHPGVSSALGFAESGKKLVLAVGDSAHIWETGTGKRLKGDNKPGRWIRAAGVLVLRGESVLSPDGNLLARPHADPANGAFSVKLTEVATGKELPEIPFERSVASAMTFAPDGKRLAWATSAGAVQLWDLAARKVAVELPGGGRFGDRVSSLAFSADGKTLAVNRTDGRIEVWDVATRKRRVQLGESEPPTQMDAFLILTALARPVEAAFSPDGKTLAFCNGSAVRLLDVAAGKAVGPGEAGHRDAVSSLGLLADGKTLATHARGDAVLLWDVVTGKQLRRVHVPGGPAEAALSPDGAILATLAAGPAVVLYEAATGKELRRLQAKGQRINALAFSPDGKTLAVRTGTERIQLWDVATGKPLRALGEEPEPGLRQAVVLRGVVGTMTRDLAFSPDGRLLAAGGGQNQIRLWDTASGRKLRELTLTDGQVVKHFAFAPDGRSLAAVNLDGTATLFETTTGEKRHQFGKPDGAGVRPSPVRFFPPGGMAGSEPASPFRVNFSPDGRLLAVASEGPAMRLWDVRTGKEVKQLRGHQGGVVSLAFARDGKRLISGSLDTTALVWDTATLVAGAEPPRGGELPEGEAKQLWADLAANDAGRSFEALRRLGGAPNAAAALLRGRLQPRVAPEAKQVARLLDDLNSKSFAARKKATEELEKVGELVEAELRAALAKAGSVEVRHRLERLLKRLDEKALPVETLRDIRAVEVLEYAGTAEARRLLRDLAGGAPTSRLTREARAALQRLERRPSPR